MSVQNTVASGLYALGVTALILAITCAYVGWYEGVSPKFLLSIFVLIIVAALFLRDFFNLRRWKKQPPAVNP